VWALLALMLLHDARRAARVDAQGGYAGRPVHHRHRDHRGRRLLT
jgi:predicted RNA polymerase sigma factor